MAPDAMIGGIPYDGPPRLAGEIRVETAFIIERLTQAFVITQRVGDQARYATLQWHEKEPGVDIEEFTLELGGQQAESFLESLRAIAATTRAAKEEAAELAALRQRVKLLATENDLLRANLGDFRQYLQPRDAG